MQIINKSAYFQVLTDPALRIRTLSTTFCICLFLALLSGCATNPVTGGSDFVLMSEEQEIALGRKYNTEILKEQPAYENAALAALVQRVGERVAAGSHRPELIYRFTVVDSDSVNAFALPGGYIYITRGLLAYLNSEAELAAVLGHEIGHVTARHSVRQHSTATATGLLGAVFSASTGIQGMDTLTNLAGTAIVRGYGREHELEADKLGAEYLAKSGYDPDAMLRVIDVLKYQEEFEKSRAGEEDREPNVYHGLFSTHPENDQRLQEVIQAAEQYKTGATRVNNREGFLQALVGVTFGDSEKDGIVRENRLYHKDLDFAVSFPAGWRIDNQKDKILGIPKGNDGLIQLTVTDRNKRISPQEFMTDRLKLDKLQHGEALQGHGLTGYTAIAKSKTTFGTRPVRYAVWYWNDRAYIFAGAAKDANNPTQYDETILATARSFHPLTAQEKHLARAMKLQLTRAAPDSRYRELAARSPVTNYPEQQLRLLNAQYPEGEPQPGQLLKIVE